MKVSSGLLLVPLVAEALSVTSANAASCTEVSVERDATYCIAGPVCSGAGAVPTGSACPKKGDVAIQNCLKNLQSYVDGDQCVAPVDAKCMKLHTGAWGCTWSDASPTSASCPLIPGWEKNSETRTEAIPCLGVPGWARHSAGTPCPGIPGWQKVRPIVAPGWEATKLVETPYIAVPGWDNPACVPLAPCPGTPGWEKPSSTPSTPPEIPGWEKPTPAPSTPCPFIPGWEKPNDAVTSAPTTTIPCPVIPGWEKPTNASATTAPTTSAPLLTNHTSLPPAGETMVPTAAPTSAAPAVTVVAVQLSAAHESEITSDRINSHTVAMTS